MEYEIVINDPNITFYRFSEKKNEGFTHIFEWWTWNDQYIDNALKDRERALVEKYKEELSAEVLQELNRTADARQALQDLFAFLKDEGIATEKAEQ